ncbi:hypothetical protein [Pedosphaera parvula]|uniref:Uncharacterized protein n=1 Tax=Pedosphaera parvula (strain Ellin514) TaxID=320771 RepID=B9XPI8_PEDPL|nr:hypothetical protein [Pedosphaera parvula]EEF58216.1 hypothetical protein Cflav_PD1416 [Pedosphaera parvula Ellin514]
MNEARPKQYLWKQSLGAILWGLCFVLAPFEIPVYGAILWLPALIWLERLRTKRYGFWPGALCRFAVVLSIVVIAAKAPLKREDHHVGPLPNKQVTFAELVAAQIIYPPFGSNHYSLKITLPSTNPTVREVMHAITQQTGMRASIFHCASGATILHGSGGGSIRVSEPLK